MYSSLNVACGLLARSLAAYTGANLGYSAAQLVDVAGPPINAGLYPSLGAQQQYVQHLYRNIASIPGVRGVAFGSAVPFMGAHGEEHIALTCRLLPGAIVHTMR